MPSVNKAIIVGHVGLAPELRKTSSGKSVVSFNVATNEKRQGNEATEWHSIVAWEKQAEFAAEHIEKGDMVYVEGRITTRSWESEGQKKYKTEIVGYSVQLLWKKSPKPQVAPNVQPAQELHPTEADGSEDLPF